MQKNCVSCAWVYDAFITSVEDQARTAAVMALVSERGESLPDSRLIIDYLQARSRPLSALPRGSQRWAALRRLQLAESELGRPRAVVWLALDVRLGP